MHCAKFGWNWPSGSGERFLNFVDVTSLFRNYLPIQKGGTIHLKNNESSSPKCQIWTWSGGCGDENEKVNDDDNNDDDNDDGQHINFDQKTH